MKGPLWYQGLELFGLVAFPTALFFLVFSQFDLWQTLTAYQLILSFIGGWLFSDFLSGVVHWGADTYGDENTPFFGQGLIHPFREHHDLPGKMTTHSYLFTNGSLYFGSTLFLMSTLFFTSPLVKLNLIVLAFWVAHTNQIHKWAHCRPRELSLFVKILFKLRIIISPKRHSNHHQGEFNQSYCITSGWCNPILNHLNFWRRLERLIEVVTKPLSRLFLRAS